MCSLTSFSLTNDKVVNTDNEILEEAKSFYQNLYSSANTLPDIKEENMFFQPEIILSSMSKSKNIAKAS